MQPRRNGFWSTDAIVGLMLVAVLSVGVVAVVNRQNTASQKLAETRATMRLAELVMGELQSGASSTKSPDAQVVIESVSSGNAPAGRKWVRVSVTLGDSREDVLGIVPESVYDTPPTTSPTTRGAS